MPARVERPQGAAGDGEHPVPVRRFTREELALYDGRCPERPILTAYRGRVYDVTGNFMWMKGQHFWLRAGQDLTAHLAEAPHREEVFERVPWVGILDE